MSMNCGIRESHQHCDSHIKVSSVRTFSPIMDPKIPAREKGAHFMYSAVAAGSAPVAAVPSPTAFNRPEHFFRASKMTEAFRNSN